MPKEPTSGQAVYDAVRDVGQGINASIDPLLLERNQLAAFRNGTARGTFATHRPSYITRGWVYPDATIQQVFEQGVFQGAGYYRPDVGAESIVMQVGGRIFQVQISGNTPTVTEVTVPGSPNSSSVSQVWMWQAEKWMIINDGVNLPVFFDGNTSRRSFGPQVSVGTISVQKAAPAVGGVDSYTFASNFSGPFNVPLRVTNSAGGVNGLFVAVGTGGTFSGYPVTLKNVNDTAGATEAASTVVTSQTNIVGVSGPTVNMSAGTWTALSFDLASPTTFPVGTAVSIPFSFGAKTGTITSITGVTIRVTFDHSFTLGSTVLNAIPPGSNITTPNGQSTTIANLYSPFTVPAVGATVTANFDRAYTGSLNQTVYVGSKQYVLTAVQTPQSSQTVLLQNISWTAATAISAGAAVTTVAELPVGRMGCYGQGRVWMSLTDGRSFVAGDIVGGASGSLTYSFRDAVLKMQENTILNGGGSFVVPGQVGDIRAMIFTAVLDTSLGQGPLAILTPYTVFTCQVPTDRTTWQNLTTPILTEGMKGVGGLGQNSTILSNSDVIMRSLLGISSYIQSRRDFSVWGNVPQSREVDPFIAGDRVDLLQFGSAVQFDNRLLMTGAPANSPVGVVWGEIVALNYDPISSLRGKAPSIYDGIWDGLNVLQLVKGTFNGDERCFSICASDDQTSIELIELLNSSDSSFQDNDTDRIAWELETAELGFGVDDPRLRRPLRLVNGELRIDLMDQTLYGADITVPHTVTIEAFYKPDQWPTWVPWKTVEVSFDPNNGDPGYRPRIALGEPGGDASDETNDRQLREASTFQFKFRVTGHCRIVNMRFKAVVMPEAGFAPTQ